MLNICCLLEAWLGFNLNDDLELFTHLQSAQVRLFVVVESPLTTDQRYSTKLVLRNGGLKFKKTINPVKL